MAQTKGSSPDRQLSAEKAEIILTGAMQEFLTHGYAATSMDRVATAAGVSKATVYSHFQDKEGLFTALIGQMAEKNFSAILGPYPLEGEPAKVLRQLTTTALDLMLGDPEHLAFIRLIIGESGRFPELAQTFVRSIDKPGLKVLTQYLATCPDLKLSDPEAAARVVVGAIVHFIIIQEMLHGRDILPMERDRLVNTLIELITGCQGQQS